MKLFKYIFVLTIIALFTSCAQAEPFAPHDNTNLLIRSKNLFSLSTLLVSQSEVYIGDVFSRLYYGYYHLGRLIFSNKFGYEFDSHNHVWKKMEEPIKEFGYSMKSLREKYDYKPLSPREVTEQSKDDLKLIIDTNKFDEIILELRTTLNESNYYSQKEKDLLLLEIILVEKEHTSLIDELQQRVH